MQFVTDTFHCIMPYCFDEANYDIKQYIVTKIIQCASSGVAAKSLICNQCHDTLKNSTDTSPDYSIKG